MESWEETTGVNSPGQVFCAFVLMEGWEMCQHSQADGGNFSFSNHMTVSDLKHPLAEVLMLIQPTFLTPVSH